jgi:hypothetical protein
MSAVISPEKKPQTGTTPQQREACLQTLFGADAEQKLHTLAKLAEQQIGPDDYWMTEFSVDLPAAKLILETQKQNLGQSSFQIQKLLPVGTHIIDLACGPAILLEEFFRSWFPGKVAAWVGVDAVAECVNKAPRITPRNKELADVPGVRIQADALSCLQLLTPSPQTALSFYTANWPYSFSDEYVTQACTRIDALCQQNSLVFASSKAVENFFRARPG